MADDTATDRYNTALAEYAAAKAENDTIRQTLIDANAKMQPSDSRLWAARDALAAAALAKDGNQAQAQAS